MDHLFSMKVFCQIVDSGSMAQAARVLGLAPATVTGALAGLESRLSARLLDRTTRRIAVTEAGRLWYKHSKRIIEQSQEAEDAVRSLASDPRGDLRLTLPLGVALTFVYPHLHEFTERFPKIGLDLQVNDRPVDLVANGFDLALRAGYPVDSDFSARRLITYRRLTCASPDYLAIHGSPRHPSELEQHQCLVYRHEPQPSHWQYRVDGETLAIPVKSAFSSNESHALIAWAKAGMGITRQPEWLVERELRGGDLIRVLEEYDGIDASRQPGIYAIFPKARNHPKKVEAFVTFFSQKIGYACSAVV